MFKGTTVESFWAKVDKSGVCWTWTGSIDKHGYGRYKASYAHRYSFELHTAEAIKQGRQIDHICHNRSCVRPDHLRSVTNKQNGENRAGPNSNSTSGVRGVHWNKRHAMWCAQFKHKGRSIYVGMYHSLEEAEKAIIAKRNKVFTCNVIDRATTRRGVAK